MCTVYSVLFIVYSVLSVYSVQCIVYSVQGIVYSVLFIVYSVHRETEAGHCMLLCIFREGFKDLVIP